MSIGGSNSTISNGSGNLTITPAANLIVSQGNVGIGTTTPTAVLDVAGAASVSGSLTFRTGASSIQTTAFNPLTIGGSTTGNITLNPSNAADGGFVAPATTNVSTLGTASLLWKDVYATTLHQGINQVCDVSGNCSSIGNFWATGAGALYPVNNTVDLLIGSTATTSAKFAFKGVYRELQLPPSQVQPILPPSSTEMEIFQPQIGVI